MKPIIGITMGDPAGIGSEITVKMFSNENLYSMCIPIVIGAKVALDNIRNILGENDLEVYCVEDVADCRLKNGVINLLNLDNIKEGDFRYGEVSYIAGKVSGEYIVKGIQMALNKEIDALVTNPIHKESFKLGGYGEKYAGHTEMLADMTGTKDCTMMLATDTLRVVHISTHVSLRKALKLVRKDRIAKVIKIANQGCLSLGIQNPRVAVAGLNPHCGDGGLFGEEEINEIIPAIEESKLAGTNVTGPIPPDIIFAKALGGFFDVVVSMYHDQGHIPAKTIGFQWDKSANSWGKMRGVNITLGLPIIRTSVDHGTAFGKAGKGNADYTSLFEAVKYAIKMVENKKYRGEQQWKSMEKV